MTTMTKADQIAEAAARAEAAGAVPGDEIVSDINDATGEEGDSGSPQRTENAGDEDSSGRPKPIHMSPSDQARIELAKKFRRQAVKDDVPFNGDMNDPEMLYGKSGREELEPDPAAPDLLVPAVKPVIQPDAPKTRTVTVRGKAVEMTDDEILAAAQKNLAADSYLDEARDLLQEAKQIKAERAGRAPQHPEGDTQRTQDDELMNDPDEARQHPGDELEQAIEQIQFGDPKEAAAKIRKVMRDVSEKEADEGQMRRLVKNDIARVQVVLKTFSDANPTIANDKIAAQAIEQFVYDVTREEIERLGDVDPSKIPQNPAELANWHRFYRINGRSVSNPEALLESAKGRYLKWKGVSEKPVVPAAKAAPRVVVNVDRTERRAAIPNQPTRSMAPRPDAQNRQPEGKSRSDVIMKMRQQRGQSVA
jgi:hypothetical protein